MYALEDPIGDTVLQSGGLVQRFEFVEHGLRYYRLLRCTRADKIPEFRFTHLGEGLSFVPSSAGKHAMQANTHWSRSHGS